LCELQKAIGNLFVLADQIGIPRTAIAAEVRDFVVHQTTLTTDTHRPTASGFVVGYNFGGDSVEGCTMGYNVRVNGSLYFLIASHCTRNFTGGIDQQWNQSDIGSQVGNTSLNPAWSTLCIPGASYCRETDAALVAYLGTVAVDYKIAETSGQGTGNNPGNRLVQSYRDVFTPQRGGARMMGDSVYKTGANTGTTKGVVVGTCATTPPDKGNHTSINCANEAAMDDQAGDSGAPVYYFRFPLSPNYRVPEGLAWGFSTSGFQIITLFNTWDQIEAELGVTMDPTKPCC
jgi:hypothetical protein